MNWVRYALQSFTGEKISPAHAIVRQKGGKFFYDLTPGDLQDIYVTVANSGDKSQGSFIGGATYGALQYLGVYMRDKALPPLKRRTVFLDNPGLYLAGNIVPPAFGPSATWWGRRRRHSRPGRTDTPDMVSAFDGSEW